MENLVNNGYNNQRLVQQITGSENITRCLCSGTNIQHKINIVSKELKILLSDIEMQHLKIV